MSEQGERYYLIASVATTFEAIFDALDEMRDSSTDEFRNAVDAAVEKIRDDALANLDRPNWLLSKYLKTKVRTYGDGRYLFGMAGVSRPSKEKNPRDPGYYGYFHEYGYFENLKKSRGKEERVRGADRLHYVRGRSYEQTKRKLFFRNALSKNRQQFRNAVYDAYQIVLQAAREKIHEEVKRQRYKELRRQKEVAAHRKSWNEMELG